MPLSVLSALARSDVDPWQEATKLARLPPDTAKERLAAMIGALPGGSTAPFDIGTITARLIALLPRPTVSAVAPHKQLLAGAAMQMPAVRSTVTCAILLALLVGAKLFMADHPAPPQQPQQVDRTVASDPGAISPQTGTLPTGK